MIRAPSFRDALDELFGWWSSAIREGGLAGTPVDVASRMIADIARSDVIGCFIAELNHVVVPERKAQETFPATPRPAA